MSNETENLDLSTSTDTTSTTSTDTSASSPSTLASTDWKASLPEDLRNEPSLASIKDVTGLAKGFTSAQKMLGGRIPIPSEDASEEVRNEFYSKVTALPGILKLPEANDPKAEEAMGRVYDRLGRPKTADKYELNIPNDLPVDQDFVQSIKETAHKVGLNNAQLQALASLEVERSQQLLNVMKTQKDNTVAFLKQEWGNAFEDNKACYQGVLKKFAEKYPDAVNELKSGYAGNNVVMVMMAAELGRIYQEQGTIAPRGQAQGSKSPEQALAQINDVMANKAHPYHDYNSPAHNDAVKKVEALYRDAYPQQSPSHD